MSDAQLRACSRAGRSSSPVVWRPWPRNADRAAARARRATRFLVVLRPEPGTGAQPEGPDVEMSSLDDVETSDDSHRELPGRGARDRVAVRQRCSTRSWSASIPTGAAIVLVAAVPRRALRSVTDARSARGGRSGLRSRTRRRVDDAVRRRRGAATGIGVVVPADGSSIARAAAALDRGAGTVWSGDARDGFNGGGALVRWVRDDADRAEALDLLVPRCDRVRVASFVEGVPCSIHGFVVDDGVAVFRPVELVTLRAPSRAAVAVTAAARRSSIRRPTTSRRCATRRARVGEHLRATVGFRGAFTLDGIAAADGWVATECNPRFGAGLGYVDAAFPSCRCVLLHHAVGRGRGRRARARRSSASSSRRRRAPGGAARGRPSTRVDLRDHDDSGRRRRGRFPARGRRRAGRRRAVDSARVGPAGHVRLDFDPARTPRGPSIAPLDGRGLGVRRRGSGSTSALGRTSRAEPWPCRGVAASLELARGLRGFRRSRQVTGAAADDLAERGEVLAAVARVDRRLEHGAHELGTRRGDAGPRRLAQHEIDVLGHQRGHEAGLPAVRRGRVGPRALERDAGADRGAVAGRVRHHLVTRRRGRRLPSPPARTPRTPRASAPRTRAGCRASRPGRSPGRPRAR